MACKGQFQQCSHCRRLRWPSTTLEISSVPSGQRSLSAAATGRGWVWAGSFRPIALC